MVVGRRPAAHHIGMKGADFHLLFIGGCHFVEGECYNKVVNGF